MTLHLITPTICANLLSLFANLISRRLICISVACSKVVRLEITTCLNVSCSGEIKISAPLPLNTLMTFNNNSQTNVAPASSAFSPCQRLFFRDYLVFVPTGGGAEIPIPTHQSVVFLSVQTCPPLRLLPKHWDSLSAPIEMSAMLSCARQ